MKPVLFLIESCCLTKGCPEVPSNMPLTRLYRLGAYTCLILLLPTIALVLLAPIFLKRLDGRTQIMRQTEGQHRDRRMAYQRANNRYAVTSGSELNLTEQVGSKAKTDEGIHTKASMGFHHQDAVRRLRVLLLNTISEQQITGCGRESKWMHRCKTPCFSSTATATKPSIPYTSTFRTSYSPGFPTAVLRYRNPKSRTAIGTFMPACPS